MPREETPLAAEAEQAGKMYRVALIALTPPVSAIAGPEPPTLPA
jgi:hypothetical protein